MGKAHRATGNPRGRPSRLPFDFNERIMMALRHRLNTETGLAKPDWKEIARELGVSRSTIARRMKELRESGAFESILVEINPRFHLAYYRLKD